MRKLLNTLYVTSEDAFLSLNGETVEINFSDDTKQSIPLVALESIICFSYKGASPALMGKCASNNISLTFFTPQNKFLAEVSNHSFGNVLLRREQFRMADNSKDSLEIAKNMIIGKFHNSKYVLHRCIRDHPLQTDVMKIDSVCKKLTEYIYNARNSDSIDKLRGIEGNAAVDYFSAFDELILQNKDVFRFEKRSRRPPENNVNALLSFAYSLLSNDCAAALKGVGLDPFVGFMHTDRPGRQSLALDIEEELRSVIADRFVITLINNRIITEKEFVKQDTGAVLLTDNGRKIFLSEWQKKKREEIVHPFLNVKIPWGLVPHIQAMLLAKYIRKDLDGYPPFLWK